jgi:hypothetical protein
MATTWECEALSSLSFSSAPSAEAYDTTVASGEYTKGLRPTTVRYPNNRLVHLTYGTTGANGDAGRGGDEAR